MKKPFALQTGDTVMIVAPAGPSDELAIARMCRKLEGLGLSVRVGKGVSQRRGYLAGDDATRLADLHEAFSNQAIKAIFAARGGYGSARLLSQLNFSLIKQNPKIFWGYSDITALHVAFLQRAGLVTFHGPMMEEGGRTEDPPFSSLQQLFSPTSITFTAADQKTYPSFAETITAPIIGGNLTVLASTIGTPYELDTTDKILLLEDIGEEPYRIDRMLNQLRLAGKLAHCAGVVVTDFHRCEAREASTSLTLAEVVYDHIVPYQIPILSGFPIGHCQGNEGIPLGVKVTMNGQTKTVSFEAGIQSLCK